ncbi:hypothetical protein [Aliikangiella sp. IMCC44359]|uniref:hypothetical protein n=1 Tax=Aliikangiella sp. IMCC44359 TaxID=3459125 RepID=UPI00403ABFEB
MKLNKEEFKKLSTDDACDWLCKEYPVESDSYGEVFAYLPLKSWSKSQQKILAKTYLKKAPFASSRPYEVFLSFMSVKKFLEIIEMYIPAEEDKLDLLKYHLKSVIKNLKKSEREVELIKEFVTRLE